MRIKFNKQITVEFIKDSDEHEGFFVEHDKTFYPNKIVEVNDVTETIRGFADIMFDDGTAVGIPIHSFDIV